MMQPAFIKEIVRPINAQDGERLKVSDFIKHGMVDGTLKNGTAAFEKRGVEAFNPEWTADNCIQCNKCAYVCPHGCIRPFVLDEAEHAQFNDTTLDMKVPKTMAGMHFRIQVSVLDCVGCGNCADVCPGNKNGKALDMVPFTHDESKSRTGTTLLRTLNQNKILLTFKAM